MGKPRKGRDKGSSSSGTGNITEEEKLNSKVEEEIKRCAEAVDSLTTTISNSTNPPHYLYSNRSNAYASLGKFKEALVDAKETVRLDPYGVKGYLCLGVAYSGLEDYAKAVDAYKKGLKNFPTNDILVSGLKAAEDLDVVHVEFVTPLTYGIVEFEWKNVCHNDDFVKQRELGKGTKKNPFRLPKWINDSHLAALQLNTERNICERFFSYIFVDSELTHIYDTMEKYFKEETPHKVKREIKRRTTANALRHDNTVSVCYDCDVPIEVPRSVAEKFCEIKKQIGGNSKAFIDVPFTAPLLEKIAAFGESYRKINYYYTDTDVKKHNRSKCLRGWDDNELKSAVELATSLGHDLAETLKKELDRRVTDKSMKEALFDDLLTFVEKIIKQKVPKVTTQPFKEELDDAIVKLIQDGFGDTLLQKIEHCLLEDIQCSIETEFANLQDNLVTHNSVMIPWLDTLCKKICERVEVALIEKISTRLKYSSLTDPLKETK